MKKKYIHVGPILVNYKFKLRILTLISTETYIVWHGNHMNGFQEFSVFWYEAVHEGPSLCMVNTQHLCICKIIYFNILIMYINTKRNVTLGSGAPKTPRGKKDVSRGSSVGLGLFDPKLGSCELLYASVAFLLQESVH